MEANVVCVSKFFVNKDGVRSTSNVPALRAARRATPNQFLRLVLAEAPPSPEDRAALEATADRTLRELRDNLADWCARDRRDEPQGRAPALAPVRKELVARACESAVLAVVPAAWLGCASNRQAMCDSVRRAVCGMRGEHLPLRRIAGRWRPLRLAWGGPAPPVSAARAFVYALLLWLLRYVVSTAILLRYYVTSVKGDPDEYKLYYYDRRAWQSHRDRALRALARGGAVVWERRATPAERHSLPRLLLSLKTDGRLRPLVRYSPTQLSKADIDQRKRYLKSLIKSVKPRVESFNTQYTRFYKKWVAADRPALYFVKADLADAFGSVNREELVDIIEKCHVRAWPGRENTAVRLVVCEDERAVWGRALLRWGRGLVQGHPLSPLLAELYYAHRDWRAPLADHSGLTLARRIVDDYLFISDNCASACNFLNTLSARETLNARKTVTNFPHASAAFVSPIVEFVGYEYDTRCLSVSRSARRLAGRAWQRSALTASVGDVAYHLGRRLGPAALPADPHLFNLTYNSPRNVWSLVFTQFCLAAAKLCGILAVLNVPSDEQMSLLSTYGACVARLSVAMLGLVGPLVRCGNHLRCAGWTALLGAARGTPRVRGLVTAVRGQLRRVDCARGRWRPHRASLTMAAHPELCRDHLFVDLLCYWEKQPFIFDCYTNKSLDH